MTWLLLWSIFTYEPTTYIAEAVSTNSITQVGLCSQVMAGSRLSSSSFHAHKYNYCNGLNLSLASMFTVAQRDNACCWCCVLVYWLVAYMKPDVAPKFIKSMSHNVSGNKVKRSHSLWTSEDCGKAGITQGISSRSEAHINDWIPTVELRNALTKDSKAPSCFLSVLDPLEAPTLQIFPFYQTYNNAATGYPTEWTERWCHSS